jgi:hypothetical protein
MRQLKGKIVMVNLLRFRPRQLLAPPRERLCLAHPTSMLRARARINNSPVDSRQYEVGF